MIFTNGVRQTWENTGSCKEGRMKIELMRNIIRNENLNLHRQ